jgi:hypothetical protein
MMRIAVLGLASAFFFAGCEMASGIMVKLGFVAEDEPDNGPVIAERGDNLVHLTLYVNSGSHSGEMKTEPFQTVVAALARVVDIYADSGNPRPEKGKPAGKSAAIVLLDTATVSKYVKLSGVGTYPPLILRAKSPKGTGDLTLNANGILLTVGDGVTLTLRDIVFQENYAGGPLVQVQPGGHLILEDGAAISEAAGPGVMVADGALTMTGRMISGNSAAIDGYWANAFGGGGALVYHGNIFVKTGGIIYGNNNNTHGDSTPNENIVLNNAIGHAARVMNSSRHTAHKRDAPVCLSHKAPSPRPAAPIPPLSLGATGINEQIRESVPKLG